MLYGSMGGRIVNNFDLGSLVGKRIQLLTTTLKTRSTEYKKKLLSEMAKHFFDHPEFISVTHAILPMSEACKAHEMMESNTTIGKILLKYDL